MTFWSLASLSLGQFEPSPEILGDAELLSDVLAEIQNNNAQVETLRIQTS